MDLTWTPELLRWFGEHVLAGAAMLVIGLVGVGVGRDLTSEPESD